MVDLGEDSLLHFLTVVHAEIISFVKRCLASPEKSDDDRVCMLL